MTLRLLILTTFPTLVLCSIYGCTERPTGLADPAINYKSYTQKSSDIVISRADYKNKLEGFWLAQCIANWTGLITEMDKLGGDGHAGRGAGFYTRENWGKPDHPAIWESPDHYDSTRLIDFVFVNEDGVWGADDDTDIEYIYQHLIYTNKTALLSPEQIREGWLTHIYSDANTPFGTSELPENYLWVSNQKAHDLMKDGLLPPATSDPVNNPFYDMIDAQLTTEILGLYAPGRPNAALQIAYLPIRVTASHNAALASEFYVIMHSLAPIADPKLSVGDQLKWMAPEARDRTPDTSYIAKMYDYVLSKYHSGLTWEQARDSVYQRYQVDQADGYFWATMDESCGGCFAAGINFAAGVVSLLYGEGDLGQTIQIGALAGWDSDNPTATWGGLIGFLVGKQGVEKAFGRKFSNTFNIHRTRGGFANDGIDDFSNMAQKGVFVVDRVVQDQLNGGVDLKDDVWYIPTN